MKIIKFTEANLTIKELKRPAKKGLRGDTLIKKLTGKEVFSFAPKGKNKFDAKIKNAEEIIDNIADENSDYDPESGQKFFIKPNSVLYKKVIQAQGKDDLYPLNSLEKTEEFGSSSGVSLGTKSTWIIESIQCLFLAFKQTQPDTLLTRDKISDIFTKDGDIRQKLLEQIRVPVELTPELINQYLPVWGNTFINCANALYHVKPVYVGPSNEMNYVLDKKTNYIFYHEFYNGGFIVGLSEMYKKLTKASRIPISKWSPSDIWAVSKNFKTANMFADCKSIEDMSQEINNLFWNPTTGKRSVVGISLKKMQQIKDVQNTKMIINRLTPVPTFEFDRVVTSTNPLKTIGVKIIATQLSEIPEENNMVARMDVRAFTGGDRSSDISGEILGKIARGGKVGLARINRIIEMINKEFNTQIPQIQTRNQLNNFSDEELISSIKEMNKLIQQTYQVTELQDTTEKIGFRAKILSKYQALKFSCILLDYSGKMINFAGTEITVSDKIVQDMFYYALAIKNDVFECPMYVRII